ncbi:hypothetical protein [Enterococcus pallens]|uniref:Uncharacterized protein n=1 Tax=Enterococcus pallens ATCC BAA-351 TaxID=1158607 RepID=R2S8C6_9ENTE|nr:hypothetical protein [Enterococcus pallens]EOH91810.1 hypothetical protein UAU_03112 [Enterococcus pallens ATCC BAA-351]EOU25238.1 hypothetical protein I588_01226 [Enterococcus pallens ATCC BAA-351]
MPTTELGNLMVVSGILFMLIPPVIFLIAIYFIVKRAVYKGMEQYHSRNKTNISTEE